MDLRGLGEFGVIRALRRRAGRPTRWPVGIGDDAALLRPRPGYEIAVSVDSLVEGVHFRWSTTPPRALGRKLLRVNLSDVGAMGARPLGCVLALGLPADAGSDRLDGFVAGLLTEARAAGCPLVGGDTVAAPVWQLSLTIVGEVPRGRALRRSGARPGDRLAVTGALGASALGLHILEGDGPRNAEERRFARAHLLPRPPWRAGAALARCAWAHAAIDLSDGLVGDLGHLLEESGVGAEVDVASLPLARGLGATCGTLDLDPLALAISGGEDFQLLFCVSPRAPAATQMARRLGCRVTEIGRITRTPGVTWRGVERVRWTGPRAPWEHFKPR